MLVGEGEGERNTPARTICSFGKPFQILDGGSDWCGDHLLSIKSIFSFRFFRGRITTQMRMWGICEAWIRPSKKIFRISGLGISLELRSEQKEAILTLLSRTDLLAVLPTALGKTLIFQLFVRVRISCRTNPHV